MILGLRENLKGTVVISIIVLFFILPMVISGVGSSWLSSVAGTDAAVVDGETISNQAVNREVYMQKQRLLSQQGVDPSADYLKDENLRAPVLDRLTKKAAVIASIKSAGMAASDATVNTQIVAQKDFQTDGVFDPQLYRSLLSRIGSSPALYKSELVESVMLQQLDAGLDKSSFVTEAEKAALVEIIYEQRSFYTADIPVEGLAEGITVSDDAIATYYESNQAQFSQPEQLSIEYIELSVTALANTETVSDEEISTQYDLEVADFSSSAEYEIAHILVDKNAEDKDDRLAELQTKIAAGEEFAELAKVYSDDAGSKDSGGSLGVLLSGIFPEAFEKAVYLLEEGEVSAPVSTDSGVHLIKVVSKSVDEMPSFDERKNAIAAALKTAKAEEIFSSSLELLEELTFNSDSLDDAAAEVGAEVQVSSMFERSNGLGIASNAKIREVAFGDEVLVDGRNSEVLELAGNRAVVLRLKSHSPEHIKPLEAVTAQIQELIVENEVAAILTDKADAFIASVKAGSEANTLADDLGYGFAVHENTTRSAPVSDPTTRRAVFSAPMVQGVTTFEMNKNADGSMRVVGITSKKPGSIADLDALDITGLASQLTTENSRYEGGAFQANVIAGAEIEIH